VPLRSNVLVAENPGESTVDPHRDVEHRRDPAGRRVVLQIARPRVGHDVVDGQEPRAANRVEVGAVVDLEQRGAALEHSGGHDVAGLAVEARRLVAEAPEAHAVDVEQFGVDLDDVADRRVPVALGRGGQLEQPTSHGTLARRIGWAERRWRGLSGHAANPAPTPQVPPSPHLSTTGGFRARSSGSAPSRSSTAQGRGTCEGRRAAGRWIGLRHRRRR
jgi:hypothetical protein